MANRHNGRTGMGLVMASKNLKAIVVKGSQKIGSGRPACPGGAQQGWPKVDAG